MINKTNKSILIFCVFAFGFFISNLLRSITATLTPILTTEFDLSAGNLGLLAGGYFIGFSIMQIPVGLLLDKHGPKKIISFFLVIAVIGTLSFALAKTFTGLLISRVFIGVGVSACMMGPLTGYRVWFAEKYQQRANSWMLMVGAIGMLSSSLPVQYFIPAIGWRGVFIFLTGLTLVCIILVIIFIPKWQSEVKLKKVSYSELKIVWQNSFFRSLVPMGFFNYGGLFAIQTLWAGPWMTRVSGYTADESAKGLFLIYFCLLISFLVWGYFVPRFSKNIKDAVKLLRWGAPLNLIVLSLIIYLGSSAGASHWALFAVSSIFLSLTQPAVGMAFSISNAGKALTSFNLLLFVGAFFIQWVIGIIIDFGISIGMNEINSFRLSMFFVFLTSLLSYFYFLKKSNSFNH